MNEDPNAPWLFVIDTEEYAGNFERELCAYITGKVGDCDVGEEEAVIFGNEVGEALDNIENETDEYGCSRPVTIYPTPDWYNDGMGGCYTVGQEADALIAYRKRAAAYHRTEGLGIQYLNRWRKGDRDGLIEAGWDEDSLIKYAAENEAEAVAAEKTEKLGRCLCYNSVAISFSSKPTQNQIELMKNRANAFASMLDRWRPEKRRIGKIIGFRLIENNVNRSTKSTSV